MSKKGGWLAKLLARKLLLYALGSGFVGALFMGLLIFIAIVVIVNLASGFTSRWFTGLTASEQNPDQQQNAKIKNDYQNVAVQWENGLNAEQQKIVTQFQLDMPYSTLMSVGKFADNYGAKDEAKAAQSYYNDLKPTYHWVKGTGETITKHTVRTKSGSSCETNVTTFTVWELVGADVWDGTFTGHYSTHTFGSFNGCSGTETIEPVMDNWNMKYDYARFDNIEKKYNFYGSQGKSNPLPYEIMYTLQSDLYDPAIQAWSEIYGNQPLQTQVGGGFDTGGPVPTIAVSELKYVQINPAQTLNWIQSRGYNSYFTVADIQTISDAAKKYNLNPLILLAITGAEQSFDSINSYGGVVNSGDITFLREIEANPFNVYHDWMSFHPSLAICADIAARTVASHLTFPPPAGEDAILYINDPIHNPTHQIYAEDTTWAYHVRSIFYSMASGLHIQIPTN